MTPAKQSEEVTNAVILERVDTLREDLKEIGELVRCYQENQARFEKASIEERAVLRTGAEDTKRRLDGHDGQLATLMEQMKSLKESVAPLLFTNKLMTFLGSVLMISIIGLVWAIITHQVTLVFP